MPSRARVLLLLAVLAASSTACELPSPAISRPESNLPGVQAPSPSSVYPALTRPGQEFRSAGVPTDPVPLASRYVLYDDGTFDLQYLGTTPNEYYVGTYTRRDSTVTLSWAGETSIATATLLGEELRVDYNAILQQRGWVDETYLRER